MSGQKQSVPGPACVILDSPIGPLTVTAEEDCIVSVDFGVTAVPRGHSPTLDRAEREFAEYFAGERQVFTLPCRLTGTPFRVAVIGALLTVPYGETVSYGEIARRIGKPGAARAVGGALNKNPLPILYPCHRVIGADGALVGFGAPDGLHKKQTLLDLERAGGALEVRLGNDGGRAFEKAPLQTTPETSMHR